jgi:hypothetical protein
MKPMKDGWIIPLCALVTVILAGMCMHFDLKAQDLAAWVQAVGSIGAIGIAIWVAHRQFEQTRDLEARRMAEAEAKELSEIKAFAAAVKEELLVTLLSYKPTQQVLQAVPADGFFNLTFPVTQDAFAFYNNASAQVGKIPDPALRRLIVSVYAVAKGLISSFQLNNMMLGQLNLMPLNDKGQIVPTAQALGIIKSLKDYTPRLKERDTILMQTMDALIPMIDRFIA